MDIKEKVKPGDLPSEASAKEGADLRSRVKTLPDLPGVYLFKDKQGTILYIGKASSLKKRVSSYFLKSKASSPRITILIEKAHDVDFVTTQTEAEALIYEAQLIKEHKPKYNIELKDDKAYPLLKLTTDELFPRLFITRKRKGDGALYFGRYTSAKLLKQALAIMRRLFPLRTCKKMPKHICLMYHIGQCAGPCEGKVDKEKYNQIVKELILFLEGKKGKLIEELSKKMDAASKAKDFETAAACRDRMKALAQVSAGPVKEKTGLMQLKQELELPAVPFRIEAFDISNIFGNWAVGSMVSFQDGEPNKNNYRRFKIESVSGIDDYKMIKEVVKRRYSGTLEEKLPLPDLILIDGGKGHLNATLEELRDLKLSHIPVIAIAKEEEKIFTQAKEEPVRLDASNDALRLVQRIRDEAHRFAISYYRNLHRRTLSESILDRISGIGDKRKKDLIRHFGSVEYIRIAEFQDLLKLKSMNRGIARKIVTYFRKLDKLG